jgi:transcriptional regulator with XRE-family HTH domain
MNARILFGANLRRLRVERGLSQERLALEAGIDRAYVGRIERGTENATIARMEALAAVLGVAVRDLFDDLPSTGMVAGLKPGRKRK